MKKIAALGLMAAIVSAPLSAASYGVQLQGHVPVSCHVAGEATVIDLADGIADLGEIREFCNNAAGYSVFLDYAPELAGSVVMIDGVSVELGSEGVAALASEGGPSVRSRSVRIDLSGAKDTSNLSLSFRIVPN